STALTNDQRGVGFSRIQGGVVDIGAFETDTPAPDFVVDRTDDGDMRDCTAAPNDCSLRGAINYANLYTGTDTITFDPTIFASAQVITLTSDLPGIWTDMSISGPGADKLTIDGNHSHRPFRTDNVLGHALVSISEMTIANGYAAPTSNGGYGGAIYNFIATLTISNVVFTGNSTDPGYQGGALFAQQSIVTINDSTFSNNSAGYGGAIAHPGNPYGSTFTINNSTFTGNYGEFGGGAIAGVGGPSIVINHSTFTNNNTSNEHGQGGAIYGYATITDSTITGNSASGGGAFYGSNVSIVGSTISHNSTSSNGSAITADYLSLINSTVSENTSFLAYDDCSNCGTVIESGNTTIINSTIANNHAPLLQSGGVNFSGTLTIQNSILANNGLNNCLIAYPDVVVDNGHNIDSGGSCGFSGTSLSNTDPLLVLEGLQDNGGPTQTIALQSGSPAINAGDNNFAVDMDGFVLTTEQRGIGFPRIVGDTVDIGAFETQSAACPAFPYTVAAGDSHGLITAIACAN
ncbi:MAG: choice-of-anchor Q domain-containing protein, partial [Chloroflexota bacterium]